MNHEDEKNFALSIARELGSISARLASIEQILESHSDRFNPIWSRIEDHTKEITALKLKVFFISTVISVGVSLLTKIDLLKFFG